MTKFRKLELLHPALPLLLGLIITQVIATFQVYLSNLNLYTNLIIIEQAGYLTVPNQNVMPGLQGLAPALWGGLFFTLSIGAGLTLFTAAAAWVRVRLFFQNRHVMVFLVLAWIALILWINMGGINIWGTLYCVLIPLTVFTATTRLLTESGQDHNNLKVLVHLLPIILLTVLWTSQYDRHLFIDLRDHLLFSNSVGKKVSDFYYKYSPYATEAFKSLNQKTLKTCRLPQLSDPMIARSLKLKLLQQDYLPVDSDVAVDLEMVQAGNQLLIKNDGRVIMETAVGDVLTNTEQILHQFSIDTDRFAALRQDF